MGNSHLSGLILCEIRLILYYTPLMYRVLASIFYQKTRAPLQKDGRPPLTYYEQNNYPIYHSVPPIVTQ